MAGFQESFQESVPSPAEDDGISGPFPTLTTAMVDDWLDGSGVPAEDISSGDDIPDVGMGSGGEGDETSGPGSSSPSRTRNGRVARNGRASKDDDDKSQARDPKAGPPSLDEWANFFGKIVLRVACQWYVSYAFRGIDEDAISERDVERLVMTDDERRLIATPLAELSHKSKFMRKHGRMIVASGDAFNAMVVLGAYMSRVNRIAAKYKPKNPTIRVNMNGRNNEHSGQDEAEGSGAAYPEGTSGGRIPNGYPVWNPGSS